MTVPPGRSCQLSAVSCQLSVIGGWNL